MKLALVVLAACGASGNFRVQSRSYNADEIEVQRLSTEGVQGIEVTLLSDPIKNAIDDEVALRVSLYWPPDQTPSLNTEVSVGNELAVRALPRMSCFCGGTDVALVPPRVTGKMKLTRFDETHVSGDFELTFEGQVPLAGGGVLYENETLKASASGFSL